jgi:hypothetical protein
MKRLGGFYVMYAIVLRTLHCPFVKLIVENVIGSIFATLQMPKPRLHLREKGLLVPYRSAAHNLPPLYFWCHIEVPHTICRHCTSFIG